MGRDIRPTISYSCVQASFWMSLCVFMGFAAVYLQSLDYSNAELGIVLACGTLLGSLLGPALSSMIDRSTADRITASSLTPPVVGAEAVSVIVLLLFPAKGIVTSVAFALFIALSTSVNSLNLKLYTDAVYSGLDIDYGIARSMGSLGYVITSLIMGALCESISARVVPVAGLVLCAFQFLSFLRFSSYLKGGAAGQGSILTAAGNTNKNGTGGKTDSHGAERENGAGDESAEARGAEQAGGSVNEAGSSIAAFLMRNRRFTMILAGTVLIFFAHNTMCNFFINVVRNVGGDTGDMGFLNGFMALVEIPVIFFYTQLTRRRHCSTVLRFAFILFTFKAAAIAAAGSVAGIAGALLLQAPSFGLYTGAIVPYVDEMIAHEDSAKAQSLAFTVTMLGSVFASTIAGRLFDVMPVSSVMWIAAAVSAAGSILAFAGVRNTRG